MKPLRKQTFRTVALWPTIVCLCLAAPLLPTTNAKKEARNAATTRFVHGTSLQDEKGPKVDKSDAMEVTEIPCLSKPASNPSKGSARPGVVTGAAFKTEVEPNDTPATAQPLGTTPVRVRGDLFKVPIGTGDVDVFSFTASAGDRVYAATMTAFSGGSTDTVLDIIASDQTTVLETDDEDGAIGGSASNIAGTLLASAGTYYVRVRPFSTTLSGTIRPYDLYVRVLSGTPTAETEPNNNGGTPNPLPANGWVSGVIGTAADNDTFSVPANAGDTIVAILDVDPERDSPEWNARLAIGVFNGFFLLVNGSGVGGTFDDANPSEAHFMTVKAAGTYVIYVDEAVNGGAANFTYNLSVSVIPGDTARTCTNYAGTGGAITDLGITNFTVNIPDSKIIGNLQLSLNITHPATADLDVSLISPDGNEVVLFDDPATTVTALAPQIDLTLDDEAAIPVSIFGIHNGMKYQPELFARLAYFKGMQAQGTWTLRVRDDLTANAGTLNSWSLTVCEDPSTACSVAETTVYSTDFEADAGGFTHSGTADEWERGLPAFAPITTAHSGTNAFKTDLDNTYNASSNQDLLSPNINLISASGTIKLSWWQKYQMETASFDPFWVEVREVGVPANFRKLFEWKGATQTRGVGNPSVTVQMSAGWGLVQADISDFIGKNVEVRFHLESDSSVQFAGLAIDDVSVKACGQSVSCTLTCPANVTQTNDPNQCGAVVTYPAPTSTGSCGTVTCSPASGSFFPVGTTTVTCTATGGDQPGAPSGGGGGSTCSFTVTVTDDQPPTITCPANITKPTDPNLCSAVVTYPPPTIIDNCPGTFTATCIPASGSVFPKGTTTVTCTVNGFGGEAKPSSVTGVPDAITFKAGSNKRVGVVKGATPTKEAGKGSSGYSAGVNSPAAVLYSQNGVATNGSPSQNFGAADDAFDCQAADDFVVPAGEIWNVTQVNVGGTFSVAGGPAPSLNVTFYDNSGTLPGATAVASYANVATFTLAPNFNITLPSAAVLPAGTYWVSVQVNMDFDAGGQWFWSNFGDTNIASEYAWRNPGGGFGTPCASFGAGSTGCGVGGGVNRNNVFDIIGTISAPEPGTGPSCTFTVTVNDTQPPTITCPANIFVAGAATCPPTSSRTVNYTVPASDNCPGVTVVCVPPSGSIFPVGTTTVTCTATDTSGNTATCSFTVTVFTACLVDQNNPGNVVLFNTLTGEYRFCCNGLLLATGRGVLTLRGCIGTIDDQKGDRKVHIGFDFSANSGHGAGTAALFLGGSTNPKCSIIDQNMQDNLCTCPSGGPPPPEGPKK